MPPDVALTSPSMAGGDPGYLGLFGFVEAPFLQSPDARFVYHSASLAHSIETVLGRIARGDRLIAVTGDRGVGKTTLCLELTRHVAVGAALLIQIAPQVDAPDRQAARIELPLDRKPRIVIIDDAHNLDLERLRDDVLAAECAGERRLQIVLVGQVQLEPLLDRAGSFECDGIHRVRLEPLDERELIEYVERRMWIARGGVAAFREWPDDEPSGGVLWRRPRFSASAMRQLAVTSKGNPRLLNFMCDHVLARAAEQSGDRIRGRLVRRAALDIGLANPPAASHFFSAPRLAWCAVGVALAVVVVTPSVYSKRRLAEATATPSVVIRSDEAFDAFRRRTLQRAAGLAAVPDVNELLQLRDDVLSRARNSGDQRQAFTDLLAELDRITNDARARQLALDHQQFLEYAQQGR